MSEKNYDIVLASASPRRLALLKQIAIECQVMPADIDESLRPNESASNYVCRLAEEKSAAVYSRNAHSPVLAADTSLSFNGEILGKPTDLNAAYTMLSMLSGGEHQVLTGVSVRSQHGHCSAVCTTTVQFRQLRDEQIQAYCDSKEPLGKAGSYAIQGLGGVLVETMSGSYSNVVGLPLYETSLLLEQSGVRVLRA